MWAVAYEIWRLGSANGRTRFGSVRRKIVTWLCVVKSGLQVGRHVVKLPEKSFCRYNPPKKAASEGSVVRLVGRAERIEGGGEYTGEQVSQLAVLLARRTRSGRVLVICKFG